MSFPTAGPVHRQYFPLEVSKFREMVGTLHATGLQVVLGQVFNHTAEAVPGYYRRLNAAVNVETAICCQNVATEHAAAEKRMVDSVRAALDELTVAGDGVDGKAVYLHGDGWNFGEVADHTLFKQAAQGNLAGTGIGIFDDRLRDAVHGGSPVDAGTMFVQG
ncbi:glycoside hydrolase superfamily [Podospora conica]|nr:glycoside hydrolase superfamily [Schizothecium conicum]